MSTLKTHKVIKQSTQETIFTGTEDECNIYVNQTESFGDVLSVRYLDPNKLKTHKVVNPGKDVLYYGDEEECKNYISETSHFGGEVYKDMEVKPIINPVLNIKSRSYGRTAEYLKEMEEFQKANPDTVILLASQVDQTKLSGRPLRENGQELTKEEFDDMINLIKEIGVEPLNKFKTPGSERYGKIIIASDSSDSKDHSSTVFFTKDDSELNVLGELNDDQLELFKNNIKPVYWPADIPHHERMWDIELAAMHKTHIERYGNYGQVKPLHIIRDADKINTNVKLKTLETALKALQDQAIGYVSYGGSWCLAISEDVCLEVGTGLGLHTYNDSSIKDRIIRFPEGLTMSQLMDDPKRFNSWIITNNIH